MTGTETNLTARRSAILALLSDGSFTFGGALLPLVEALRMIAADVRPVAPVQSVALDADVGRIRAEDVVPIDLLAFDNSAIDGHAVRAADADRAAAGPRVAGRVAAGQHPAAPIAPRTAG